MHSILIHTVVYCDFGGAILMTNEETILFSVLDLDPFQ